MSCSGRWVSSHDRVKRTFTREGHKLPSLISSTNLVASLIRLTINDLTAYNITIVRQNAATFFGQAALPLPPHHPDLLNRLTADEMADEESSSGKYMDLAMDPVTGKESAINDFAMQLLRTMGYASRTLGRDLRSSKVIPLFIRGVVTC